MQQEEKNIQQPQLEGDEITLKELLLKLTDYGREIRKNWFILLLLSLPFTGYFLYKAFITKPTYSATLTFMVNSDEGGGLGGVGAILGQFGLGGGGSGKDNLDKILALSKARIIIQKAIFQKATIDGTSDYFSNHIIRLYEYHKKWEKDTAGLNGFLFKNNDFSKFSRTENNALKILFAQIVGGENTDGIFGSALDKKSGIMSLSLNSRSEDLTIKLLEEIYTQLSQFYVNKTTEKQRLTYNLIANKVDSIESELSGVEYRQADFDDRNRMVLFEKAKLPKIRLSRDKTVLGLMFSEAVKNQEIAEFALKSKTPFIQSLDMPIAPIKPNKESKIKAIILGIGVGIFLGILFIVGRKIMREALA